MPRIIIGPGAGAEPAFNRPSNCVLITERVHTRCKRIRVRAERRERSGRMQRARMHIFLAMARSINSAILRAPLDLTSALLDSPIRHDTRSPTSIADIKRKREREREREGGGSFRKMHPQFYRERYCCGLLFSDPAKNRNRED